MVAVCRKTLHEVNHNFGGDTWANRLRHDLRSSGCCNLIPARSLLILLDKNGLSENREGQHEWGHASGEILNLGAKLGREKEFRGCSSVGRASRSQ